MLAWIDIISLRANPPSSAACSQMRLLFYLTIYCLFVYSVDLLVQVCPFA